MTLKISNRDARRLWIDAQGLSSAPTGPLDVLSIIKKLGFVQLDTIRTMSRAHHHILWSRNQNYREPMLWKMLAHDRSVFEHFTHDASILPTEFYPVWQRQFQRMEQKLSKYSWHEDKKLLAHVKARITAEGPLSTHAFDTVVKDKREMWKRPPHKLALDYLWHTGQLCTSHRENFKKFYDLPERVIPDDVRCQDISSKDQLNWLCREALSRLVFATPAEIGRFWGASNAQEVGAWVKGQGAKLQSVEIECADGRWTKALALSDVEQRLRTARQPTSRLRILNPFDPLIRDRTRLLRLFGLDYKIEIFIPAAKRKWGYYVYPLLEGSRFVGRIEVRAARKQNQLQVLQFWPEPCTMWTANRAEKLDAELKRLSRLAGVEQVVWNCARDPV
ncbi:MAG: YcaQ family DNA glycosylase [Robiginitomaculum sp.]|nr:YcaQ family DNA glycosylase [Robiginitomaculum sp.]